MVEAKGGAPAAGCEGKHASPQGAGALNKEFFQGPYRIIVSVLKMDRVEAWGGGGGGGGTKTLPLTPGHCVPGLPTHMVFNRFLPIKGSNHIPTPSTVPKRVNHPAQKKVAFHHDRGIAAQSTPLRFFMQRDLFMEHTSALRYRLHQRGLR